MARKCGFGNNFSIVRAWIPGVELTAPGVAQWIPGLSCCMMVRMETDARTTARRYYACSDRSLAADMRALAQNPRSVVIYMPQLVVLMKPAESAHPERWTDLSSNPAGADAWYVHLLAGDLRLAQNLARMQPVMEKLCFQRGRRNRRPHVLRWDKFTAHYRTDRKSKRTHILWDSQAN